MSVWTTDETANAFEAMASSGNGLLSVSDFMRDALDAYARSRGLLTPAQSAGHQHPAE
jgi:hypothetical protein